MSDDRRIDWDAVASDGLASADRLDRLRRVVDLFDQWNLGSEAVDLEQFRWGPLEVFEALGAGSFGTVHRAWDSHLRREVALKLLPADAPGAGGWLDEARRLARVRHPNVVAILGAEMHGEYAGIWMELSDGRSLESVLTEDPPLPRPAVLELIGALSSALNAIHERGLVHGDLKAGNVLIEPSGRVVLLDFGAAADHLAQAPARTGSPLSAAPEVLAGRALTPAADLYALGVLLYRCLCGRYPFDGDDLDALIQAQRLPPQLATAPRDFRELLRELLAPDPTQRPDTRAVIDRLAGIAVAPSRRRRRRTVGAVVASLTIGAVVATIGWWQAGAARDAEQRSAREARATLQLFQDVVGASFQGRHGQDARVIDVLEQAQRQLLLDGAQPAYVRAMIQYVVGSSYLGLGREAEGLALLDESVALLADDPDAHPVEIARVLVQQGLAACDQDAEHAEGIASDIRGIAADRLPVDHPVFAAALKVEACAAQRRGDDELAERKLREALALRPIHRFPADLAALGTAARLAAVLIDQRRIAEALPLLEATRTRALDLLGPEHDFTLGQSNTFSQALLESSRYDEAVELLEETLPAIEARSGVESQQWLATANTLAIALRHAGHPERALALTERTLDIAEAQYGPSHRYSLTFRTSRGVQLKEIGRLDDAEQAMAQAAAAVESTSGTSHPLALMNHINRVEVLVLLDRGEEAVSLGRQTLARSRDAHGPDHGLTASAEAYLARALGSIGAIDEAEGLFRQALAFQDRSNPEALHSFETRYHFAVMLTDHDRAEAARAELALLDPAFDALPSDHPLLAKIETLRNRAAP